MKHHDFYLKIADALAGCQLVEQELKLYIATAYMVVQRHLRGRVPFRFSADDCQNYPLGRLIDTFRKLTDDDELVKELRKFKNERDFLSHQAITSCLDPDMNLSVSTELEERLAEIRINADTLNARMYSAGVVLEFDDLTDAG